MKAPGLTKTTFVILALLVPASGGATWYWWRSQLGELPQGLVYGNGRIGSDQVDIATKSAARVREVLVRGFMTLATFTPGEAEVRRCFRVLHGIRDRALADAQQGADLAHLSMGMSGDCAWAIEEGATIVRVGQAVFGARPLPDSHYWPGAARTA